MNNIRKVSNYIIVISIIVFIIFAVYFKGLFFDTDFYLIEIIFSVIFIGTLYLYKNELIKLFAKPYIWSLVGIDLIYLLNVLFSTNKLIALQHSFRWIFVTQLFILIILIKGKRFVNELIWGSIVLTGIWTSIFGWLAVFKLVDYQNAFLTNRIASVFQYPNTFGALIAAILMGVLIRGTSSKWINGFAAISSYLLTLTIIYTYSRTTWIVLAIVWVIALLFLSFKKQILYAIHTILIGLGLILTLPLINGAIANNSAKEAFTAIALATIIIGLVYTLIAYFFNKINLPEKKWLRAIAPIIAILVVILGALFITNPTYVAMLPDNIEIRVSDISLDARSFQERTIFYEDSLQLIKEAPLFGQGAGAWKEQYRTIQAYPYVSSQVHNFYLQLVIEAGFIGLALFIALIVLIIYTLIKNKNSLDEDTINQKLTYGIMAFALLFHTFFDFDMAYLYILAIVIIFLALIEEPINYSIYHKASKYSLFSKISIILIIVLSIISLLNTSRYLAAHSQVKNANNIPIEQAEKKLDKAIALNPHEIDYRFMKIELLQSLYNTTKIQLYKDELTQEAIYIRDLESKDPERVLKLSKAFANSGYIFEAIKLLEKGINDTPFVKELYEQYFIYGYKASEYYKVNGKNQELEQQLTSILGYYDQFLDKRKLLDSETPALRYRTFRVSPTMDLTIGKVKIITEDYNQGIKHLLRMTGSDDEEIRKSAIAWTVYTYEKLNRNDKAAEFRASADFDPTELEEIQNIWN